MIYRIQANMPGEPIEKTATLYNNINAITVSNYGMRVKKIYEEQPWLKKRKIDELKNQKNISSEYLRKK
jgi:hypothetical protein